MGNCNYKQDKPKGKPSGKSAYLLLLNSVDKQDELSVPLHDWQGRIQQSVESRKETRPCYIRPQRNGQGPHPGKEKCEFRYE